MVFLVAHVGWWSIFFAPGLVYHELSVAKCGDLSGPDTVRVYVGDWVFEKRPDMVGQRCWFRTFVSEFCQNSGVVETVKKIQMFVRLQLSILHKLNGWSSKSWKLKDFLVFYLQVIALILFFFPNQVKWLGGIESWFPSFGTKSATSAGKGRERSWTVWILRHRQWARAEGQSDENKPAYSIIWILSWSIFYWTFVFSFRFASFSSLSSIGLWNTESTLQANISFSEKRYDFRTDLPSCMDVWVPWFDMEACGWNLAEISRNSVVDCSKGSTSSSHFGKCAQSCDMKSKLRIYNCNLNPSKINCTSLRVAIYPFLVVSPWLMGVLQKSPKYVVDNPRHVRCYSPLLEKCVYRYHLVFMTQADNIMCDSMSCKSKCWLKFFNPKNAKTDPWIGMSLCMVYVTPQVMLTVCSLTLKYVCTAELWLEGMSNRFWMCSMFWQPIQSCTACRTFT